MTPNIPQEAAGAAQLRQPDFNTRIGAIAHELRTGTRQGSPERLMLARRVVEVLLREGLLQPEAVARIDISDAGLLAIERQAIAAQAGFGGLAPQRRPTKKGGRRVLYASGPRRRSDGQLYSR